MTTSSKATTKTTVKGRVVKARVLYFDERAKPSGRWVLIVNNGDYSTHHKLDGKLKRADEAAAVAAAKDVK